MNNITNLIVTDVKFRRCFGNEYNNATILIKQCTDVQLKHVVIEESDSSYGIVGINILGDSHFSYITNNAIIFIYNDTIVDMENHSLVIDHYYVNDVNKYFKQKMNFQLNQQTYRIKIHLLNSTFQWFKNDTAISINFNADGKNILLVEHCQFSNSNISLFRSIVTNMTRYTLQSDNIVWFQNCEFRNNQMSTIEGIIHISAGPNVYINHCIFHCNQNSTALSKVRSHNIKITITNTVFSSSTSAKTKGLIYVRRSELHLQGSVIFHNISHTDSIIRLHNSKLTCFNYIEFANISGRAILDYLFQDYDLINVFVKDGAVINVTHCNFSTFVFREKHSQLYELRAYRHPSCFFQYLSGPYSGSINYSIIFDNNYYQYSAEFSFNMLSLTHCSWLPQSVFRTEMPLDINRQYIKYINESGTFNKLPQHTRPHTLCYCNINNKYDCQKELLDPIYPGQTMTLNVYTDILDIDDFLDTVITVVNNADWLPPTACTITNSSQLIQISKSHTCTVLKYTIAFHREGYHWCELYLSGLRDKINTKVDMYYIKEKPCPAGFVKSSGICQCYQFLKQFRIKCNINDQTILRPSNFWIAPIQNNNSYSYKISLHCPFYYCLPHISHLNFSTPNSQCQFNRSGILCGQCQQGLSTIFGSSHCQQCSNTYLLLIIPIAIAGLVLVLLLFILNLTVTDGTINAFILYVNIISINTPVFFPQLGKFTPTYTFISLANLDLGIQTCFYNGMDDYAKMWLQLVFPFYLIFIATALIITSRYFTTIQTLTARRALPVLATLFLLSYTKILLVVSSVLFSYSKIIHLPSTDTTAVWSIDANVPLLGIRFIILFIVCLILFLILVPFNIILLFTQYLSRFTLVTKFKPLLDAYQGPYKDNMYYWVGLQLVLRVVFFGMSALDRSINLIIGVVIITLMEGLHSFVRPFKIQIKNYQEQLFILNILILFAVALYSQDTTNMIAVNVIIGLAIIHFSVIITYHVFTYALSKMARNKLHLHISNLLEWITRNKSNPSEQQFRLNSFVRNKIPSAVKYYDYREPLIFQDLEV